MRGNIAFLAKFRRKLRTKNFEAHFNRKLRTIEKCSNVKKLRTAEPQPIFTGSYKKERVYPKPAGHRPKKLTMTPKYPKIEKSENKNHTK